MIIVFVYLLFISMLFMFIKILIEITLIYMKVSSLSVVLGDNRKTSTLSKMESTEVFG